MAQRRMIRVSLLLAASLVLAAPVEIRADPPVPSGHAHSDLSGLRPKPRPEGLGRADLRCTADRAHCIALKSYIPDVCRTIEATAKEAGLDSGFFARLIWQESLFDAAAVSPVGAQGIAQFMPGTARLRKLADPFNPAEALRASALYLAELRDTYGNIGLAAAAYNAGEARLEDFLFRDRRLPPETRAYVPRITGYGALDWRDGPPESWDLSLSQEEPFRTACEALARNRSLTAFRAPSNARPWGVIVAAHRSRDIAAVRLERAKAKSGALRGHEIDFVRMRLPARHGTQWTAQIGVDDRRQAERLCWELRKSGAGCIVLKN